MRIALLLLSIALAGCSNGTGTPTPAPTEDGRLRIAVVNHPLEYFAQRIGGDLVEVVFEAPADVDPAFWSPDPDAIVSYQSADLILLNGAGYAKWVDRVTLPASRVVDTSASFADRLIEVEGAVTHSHGPGGEHSHGEVAFTTWLDISLARAHAQAVYEAMVAARPGDEAAFRAGYDALHGDLLQLAVELGHALAAVGEVPLLGSHPVYQYLAEQHDLDLRSVHFEPDAHPDEDAWAALETLLAEHPARLMLWEAAPLPETAARLEQLGVEGVVFAPCGNRPAEGDWMTVMRENVNRLRVFAQTHPSS